MRSVLLPANLIVAALVIFAALVSNLEGDLRRVPQAIDADLPRAPGAAPAVAPGGLGNLTLDVTGLRSETGRVLITLFCHRAGSAPPAVVARRSLPASAKGVVAVFERFPRRRYAVAVVHDEDGDGELDGQGLAGGPSEGFSKGSFEAPDAPDGSPFALKVEIPLTYP